MAVSDRSIANLNPDTPHPDGTILKANGPYYKIRINGKWRYTHRMAAERYANRKLKPNERVYFTDDNPSEETYRNPGRDDIEIRTVPPRNGVTPGQRRRIIKKLYQNESDHEYLMAVLAQINEHYGKAPDDRKDAGIPVDWRPKPPRNLSGLS